MSVSLQEAIGILDISEADEHKANELPWFNELPPAAKKKAQYIYSSVLMHVYIYTIARVHEKRADNYFVIMLRE